MPQSDSAPLSVLIPTRDEERNLAACLDSVAWADEVVVLDSGSTDRTAEIARARGARIVERTFDDFAAHKNWALDNIDFRHGWILLLDADERVTPGLADEIRSAVATPGDDGPAGYYLARRTVFGGRWLRHGGVWPDYNLRLVRRGRGRYEDRIVHEHMILDGPAGYCREPLLHDDDKGLERFFDRHNTYTSLEAVEIVRARGGAAAGRTMLGGDLAARGPARRRALKNFAQRWLPARPLCVFLYMYLLKAGFLDGRAGFRYAVLKMFFEYQIALKVAELADPDSPLARRYGRYLE